jgi:hypothetical protein
MIDDLWCPWCNHRGTLHTSTGCKGIDKDGDSCYCEARQSSIYVYHQDKKGKHKNMSEIKEAIAWTAKLLVWWFLLLVIIGAVVYGIYGLGTIISLLIGGGL